MNKNEPEFVDVNNFVETNFQEDISLLSRTEFKCTYCSDNFKQGEELDEHIKIHNKKKLKDDAILKCEICKRVYKSKGHFRKHMKVHMNKTETFVKDDISCKYKCDAKPKTKSLDNTSDGALSKIPYGIKLEPTEDIDVYDDIKEADNEIKLEPTEDLNIYDDIKEAEADKDFKIPKKEFQCSQCDRSYVHRTNLINHEKTHIEGFPYHCDICGEGFKKKMHLKQHFISKHPDIKKFCCQRCGKQFKTKQQLQCHQLTHENIRPFICADCEKGFKTKQQLENHMMTHTNLKLFVCTVCEKSFSLKQQLDVHFRVHDKLKPYLCPECGKNFSLKQNLSTHLLTHIDAKPFFCDSCGKGFTTKQNFLVHVKSLESAGYCSSGRGRKRKNVEKSGDSEENLETRINDDNTNNADEVVAKKKS